MAFDPSMFAALGSMATGTGDQISGNLVSLLNFAQGLRAAQHKKLVTQKLDARHAARTGGNPNWRSVSADVSGNEEMQGLLADLAPFGIGENLGKFAFPTPTTPHGNR